MGRFSLKSFLLVHRDWLTLLTISSLTIFSKTYNIDRRIGLSWDHARDAEVIWSILIERKLTLIGPQVVSDNAFFLGPLWYYLNLPFYILTGLDPIAGSLAVLTFALFTLIAVYFFVKNLAGRTAAIIASLIWAGLPDIIPWNPILVPFFVIIILYFAFKSLDGNKKSLIYTSLAIGLALQIHFQMIFFVPLLCLLFISFTVFIRRIPVLTLLLSLSVLLLTFLPQIIFDLRHGFLNFFGLLKLFGLNSGEGVREIFYLTQLSSVIPKFTSSHFFLASLPVPGYLVGPGLIVLSVIGNLLLKISRFKKFVLIFITLAPVSFFSLYNGNLSEYYFYVCSIPILIGFSNFLKAIFNFSIIGKTLVSLLLLIIIISNLDIALRERNEMSLNDQKAVVRYLKGQKEDEKINVSFTMPYNYDAGFKYLFKYYNLNVDDVPEAHLWTIYIPKQEIIGLRFVSGDISLVRK